MPSALISQYIVRIPIKFFRKRLMRRTILRTLYLSFLIVGLLPALAPSRLVAVEQTAQPSSTQLVYLLTFQGAITPVLDKYIHDSIAAATENEAELIILQLDTPGGSVDITKAITQRMLASPIPIVVYVAPSGAQAGSAYTAARRRAAVYALPAR
jgi:membrane-bound ClpP family serine protease